MEEERRPSHSMSVWRDGNAEGKFGGVNSTNFTGEVPGTGGGLASADSRCVRDEHDVALESGRTCFAA